MRDVRIALLGSLLLAGVVSTGCGSGECSTGTVALAAASQALRATATTTVPASDLPDDFDFTATELRDAVAGTWVDSGASVELRLEPAAGPVSYRLPSGRGKCAGPNAELVAEGTLARAGTPIPITAAVLTGATLSGASARIERADGQPEAIQCSLALVLPAESAARLDGSCLENAAGGSWTPVSLVEKPAT